MKKTPPDYQIMIVPRGTAPRWRMGWMVLLAALWAASLGGVWLWASEIAAPGLLQSRIQAHEAQTALSALQQQVGTLSQRETTLGRSDQISRQANTDLQNALAQRDEEIASLRADVAFYERLVGPTAQRQGLNVHSAEFSPAGGTAWHYRITLVQNRDRNLISAGQMRFTVEGTQAGRPVTLDWSQFQAQPAATGQAYSFRYFQQLEGSVSLPEGFEPHRVRISLIAGSGANVERDFDWKASGP